MHFGYYIAISLRYLCLFSNYDFNEKIFDITISITMFICAIHHMFNLGLLFLLYFDICFFFCISLCIYTQGIDNMYLPFACSTFRYRKCICYYLRGHNESFSYSYVVFIFK